MKIYISTPINGRKEERLGDRFIAARFRCNMLHEIISADKQFDCYTEIITPFDVVPDSRMEENEAMGKCIKAVLDCDAIYLDHAWQSSKGCNLEYRAAKIYGKDIYFHDTI